ncbi:MAG: CU044_2847 family protein [Kovacikia sp.]
MSAIKATIGNTEILIQTTDVEVFGEESEYGTTTTSVKLEDIENVYTRAKSVITAIAKDIGTEMNEMGKEARRPNKLEMQFNLGFSAKANAWFLSAGGDYTLAVKMTWELEGKDG